MNQNDILQHYQTQLRHTLIVEDDGENSGPSSRGSMITKILFEFEDGVEDLD